jgi:hypothetical protein
VTPVLPRPVALPEPPGSPAALGAVVEELASAGFAAGLTVHLLEPAGVLTGWRGADAAVAGAEVAAALAVAADLHEGVTAARARLQDHHDLWLTVLARVAVLRDDQRGQFAAAGARLAVLAGAGVDGGGLPVPPEAHDVVDRLTDEDAARGVEHRALLQELAADAAGTAAVLAAVSRPLGGTGRPGQAAAITARLAVQLPGWGSGALSGLGAQAADDLIRPGAAGTLAAAVARWRPYASLPDFADALVARLGPEGVNWLLSVLATLTGTADAEPLAALLAGALGAPGHRADGRVEAVLDAVRLDPDDPDGAVEGRAVAMGLVLAAPAVDGTVATRWGRQLLAREAARGAPAGAGATGAARLPDPVHAALGALVRSGDAAAAALLLEDPVAWTTLLSRPWPGGTGDLARVVTLAAAAPEAGRVARSALHALGQGLGPDSSGRVVGDRQDLAGVRAAVTGLVSGQAGVLIPVLDAAGTGAVLDGDADTALRGLGHLVADPRSAVEVTAAVRAALRSGSAGGFAGEVAGAHVAVLEYGQRLQYALAWSHEQSRAVDRHMVWTLAVSLPMAGARGSGGELLAAGVDVIADAWDVNGEVELGPDTGPVRTAEDAARFAASTLGPAGAPDAAHPRDEAARLGFDRAGAALGRLSPPQETLLDRLGDLPTPDPSRRPARGR